MTSLDTIEWQRMEMVSYYVGSSIEMPVFEIGSAFIEHGEKTRILSTRTPNTHTWRKSRRFYKLRVELVFYGTFPLHPPSQPTSRRRRIPFCFQKMKFLIKTEGRTHWVRREEAPPLYTYRCTGTSIEWSISTCCIACSRARSYIHQWLFYYFTV